MNFQIIKTGNIVKKTRTRRISIGTFVWFEGEICVHYKGNLYHISNNDIEKVKTKSVHVYSTPANKYYPLDVIRQATIVLKDFTKREDNIKNIVKTNWSLYHVSMKIFRVKEISNDTLEIIDFKL